jgi:uncharacterized protein (DUF2336 family)
MTAQHSLIDQLEHAIAGKSVSHRADVLRKVTDLFVLGSGTFSDEHVEIFDDVMGKLIQHIEVSVRASFGGRIAPLPDAPRGVIRTLSRDEAIEVAGPVLRRSPRLDDATLVENARTLGQQHLLAISGRATLAEPVTDVLIERGDQAVIGCLADNRGARFSAPGAAALVTKTGGDEAIMLAVWSRPDIPRQHLVRLFVQASAQVQRRLVEADPRKAEQIRTAVALATDEVQTTARTGSHEHLQALHRIKALHAAGTLDETDLLDFILRGQFDHIAVALALMCDVPIGMVERALVDRQPEQLLVLGKAIGLR